MSFVRAHVGACLEGNSFEGLDAFSCADVFACVAALGFELDEAEMSNFIAEHTLHLNADVDTADVAKHTHKSTTNKRKPKKSYRDVVVGNCDVDVVC